MFIYRYMHSKDIALESDNLINPDQISDPKELNKVLNRFDYGFINKGKKVKSEKDYRSLSPSEFIKYKCGICWDYCTYEDYWFKKHGYSHKLYFMITNNTTSTHTFLVYKDNEDINIFESSWSSNKGIHQYKSYNEAISDYFSKFKKKYKSDKYVLYEYKQPSKNGLSSDEFLDHIFEFGRIIKEDN